MNYLADHDLVLYVKKKSREGWFAILLSLPGIALLGAALYFKASSNLQFALIFTPVVLLFGSFIYGSSIPIGKVINRIVSQVVIANDSVKITTFEYRFLFVTYQPIEKVIPGKDFTYTFAKFPLAKKELAKDDTYCLDIDREKYYLIYMHYPDSLMQELSGGNEL